jgi:hypothetical protein
MNLIKNIDLKKIFESIYSWIILMMIFSVYYLGYVPNGNEENYLQLAKEFFDPDWIKNSFVLNDSAGTRIIYQYIVGFFLDFLSFEFVTLIFRGFLIVAFSFILNAIYKSLQINNIMIVVHLVLIYLDKQSYFAGSWIFISVEAKSFAYLLVLIALYFIIQKKYNITVISLVGATYFHVLVGGYAFIYFGLSILIIEKFDFRNNYQLLFKLFIYVLVVSPYILWLLKNTNAPSELEPKADWIYSYFRNSHHTTLSHGFHYHLIGIFESFLALLSLIYLRKKDAFDSRMEVLYVIGIISFAGTLMLVPVIFFDENGTILKFYLFRINALSTFIFTIVFIKWIFKILKTEYSTIIYATVAIFALRALFVGALANYRNHKAYNNDPIIEVCDFIKLNTDKDVVVLGLFESNNENLSMTRRMERDRFVVYKFVPADLNKIHEWYYRVKIKNEILKDINNLTLTTDKYKIDFVLSEDIIETNSLELLYTNNAYFFYKVL